MLQITPPAIKHLVEERDERGLGQQVTARIAPSATGVGVRYGSSRHPGDQRIDGDVIDIYVAPEIVGQFDQAVIDVANRDKEKSLVIRSDPFASDRRS